MSKLSCAASGLLLAAGVFTWGCSDDAGLFHDPLDDAGSAPTSADAGFMSSPADAGFVSGPVDAGLAPDAEEPAPLDAGTSTPDAGTPVQGTRIVGLITHTLFGRTYSALMPPDPIAQVVVHVRLQAGGADVASAITGSDGTFEIPVAPGQDYVIQWDVPAEYYSEPDYQAPISALADGEVRRADRSFFLKGVSFVVSSLRDGTKLQGVRAVVVDPNVGNTLAGPALTDAEGYVHFNSTLVPGTLILERDGFVTLRLDRPSLDTSHTVMGGAGLQPSR